MIEWIKQNWVFLAVIGVFLVVPILVAAFSGEGRELKCIRACAPYAVFACITYNGTSRAACLTDDPYILNMIILDESMEVGEYWRNCHGADQDVRIPIREE